MFRVLLFVLPLFFMVGCATKPVALGDASPIATDRMMAFQTADTTKTAKLTIIRDEGFTGSACYVALWINQTLAARFATAEVANFFVEPGEVLLRVGRDPQGSGLCATEQGYWIQRETFMKPDSQKTFRIMIGGGGLDIIRYDANQTKN
jgi:hypothetical protein